MPYADIEVGIPESPVKTEEMMYELMTASSALSTSESLSAHSKVRSVLIGVWMVNILCIVPFFVYSILRDSQADLIGLGMVVVPLYISKIIESLNKVSDKLNKVYSDSEYIKLRLIEIFDACEKQTRNCPNKQIKHSVGKYIVRLSRGILEDIATCDKETKIRSLIINSVMWKSPHYTKHLDRSFVNDKATLIKSLLEC
jgi:hypothetical protein